MPIRRLAYAGGSPGQAFAGVGKESARVCGCMRLAWACSFLQGSCGEVGRAMRQRSLQ